MVSDFEAQVRATNDKINARTGRPLLRAIAVGLVLGGALLVSLILIKELYMVFAAALIGFTTFELASALRFAGRDVPRIPVLVASLAIVPAAFYWLSAGHWYVTLAGILLVSLWRIVELARPSHRVSGIELLKDLGAGAFVMAYVGFMAGFTVLLTAQEGGQWWTLAFLIVVVAVDTGAYATGLTFGKHKMAPVISPGKTWEGFAGSAAAAVIAGVLVAIFMLQQPWWVGIIFGLVLLGTATLGDLSESLIKRDLGIKDISTWLPGHGGFLDRVDSSLLSGAAAYALFLIFA
ncbi:phosphatidate cytidylyltransferase [Microbacteriaceae bacterium SG_E_30_P1]|uniref:Phosphatidate cytidylyltransferase n=1 Tax=Antiquaquibacter oligotrophicus TaxID=2880260 RepID=A0ABT6KN14_9MICO|nr:phosphatidate cytidylyltransferase [Antiquaquibacter oligotrophicus]MDH6181400.1 phosphatidate cytidylyltransferase [Antiquaquibacter oligotrophicus]UDF12908.1 phosphatidate cytidylyltransferase [Antiquaquibacter oligotrophicus]